MTMLLRNLPADNYDYNYCLWEITGTTCSRFLDTLFTRQASKHKDEIETFFLALPRGILRTQKLAIKLSSRCASNLSGFASAIKPCVNTRLT